MIPSQNKAAVQITGGRSITVGIMGTPLSSGNRGVAALASSITQLCLDAGPCVDVVHFGSNRNSFPVTVRPHGSDYRLKVVHWRMSPNCNIRHHIFVIVAASFLYRLVPLPILRHWLAISIPWIRELEATDFVGDVRGGDSFSDIYGLQRFLIATLPILSVLFVKRSLILFPQTFGPYKSGVSRWIGGWIIRRASTVIARDTESQRVAQEMAGPSQKVLLSPDVAFALHADPMETASFNFEPQTRRIPENAIGLNVNGLMFNGGYTGKNMFGLKLDYRAFLSKIAIELLTLHSGDLILVPHTYAPTGDVESDNEACRLLREGLPSVFQSRVLVVSREYDPHQLKGIIGRCTFFIGSRMHSCIAALSQGVPCVGIAYSMKFRGVFDTVGMADWVIDGRTTGTKDAVQRTLHLYGERQLHVDRMRKAAAVARNDLKELFAKVVAAHRGS